jgi:hypothetical protein
VPDKAGNYHAEGIDEQQQKIAAHDQNIDYPDKASAQNVEHAELTRLSRAQISPLVGQIQII